MKKRLLLLVVVLLLVACPPARRESPPRHVFLIVIDTLRADHLGCYGYETATSPNLNRLAEGGLLFTSAYATASSTLESVISFFTSTTALTNHVFTESIPPQYVGLHRSFQQAGYNTLAVISNPWLEYHRDFFSDGFRRVVFLGTAEDDYWPNTTAEVWRLTAELLESQFDREGRNFFYIHFLDPHDPYRPPAEHRLESTSPTPRSPGVHRLSGENDVWEKLKTDPSFSGIPRPDEVPPDHLEYLVTQYDGEIHHVDAQIGNLLSALAEMEVLADSLVVVTSDHGEEFLEHGCLKHGFQLFDETIRVPLILYAPGRIEPGKKTDLVSGIDIAPTLLGLAGLPVPASMLGRNMLEESSSSDPVLFCTHFVNQSQRGMRHGRWKVLENLRTKELKIFDLNADPAERANLFVEGSARWDDLLREFAETLQRHAPQHSPGDVRRPDLDEATAEKLRALGYM